MSDAIRSGRPMIRIGVNGIICNCFVDTGSEITLICEKMKEKLNLKGGIQPSFRSLRSASGHSFRTTEDVNLSFVLSDSVKCTHKVNIVNDTVSFPGDILIGMDWLRRFNFRMVAYHSPARNYMVFNGVRVRMAFTDCPSLGLSEITERRTQSSGTRCASAEGITPVFCAETIVCQPGSGMFITGVVSRDFPASIVQVAGKTAKVLIPRSIVQVTDGSVPIWVVNDRYQPVIFPQGSCIAQLEAVNEVYSNQFEGHSTGYLDCQQLQEDCRVRDLSSVGTESCISHEVGGSPQHQKPDIDFNEFMDDFDTKYGISDFGYNDQDFQIFPSTSMDVCTLHSPSGKDSFIPKADLDHLGSVRRAQLLDVIDRYAVLFDEDAPLGRIPGIRHTIPTADCQPTKTRQWRLPESARATIRDECAKMLRDDVIEPSMSPWLSPVVLVKKKDGGVRFCVDYKGLNRVTTADAYPMPRLDQTIDELAGTQWFTALDARSAYWTIEVEEKDRPKTAFSDGFRLFQFKRMPFGLATAPSTFQRAINAVLSPVLGKHALAYLDDVVIYSSSFEEHLDHLDETLRLLSQAGFRLNVQKCRFAVNTFKFLGFLVTPQGILPDPEKVKAIADMKPPKTVRQVRQFLGATGFFRRHIGHYASVAAPITQLLRKNTKFRWEAKQQQAFDELKSKLTSAPVLRKPNFNESFELHCDASGLAIGACLMQRNEKGMPQAVAYYSRKLRDAEKKYPVIDHEALAVVEAVRHYNPYLYGRHFQIFTDHRPLVHVFRRTTKSVRMTRWSHELSFYNYELKYKPGASHHVPDLLSRKVANIDEELSPQRVAEAQRRDPLWQELREYLEEIRVPRRRFPLPLEEFELMDGLLYHVRILPERVLQQLVIPRSLRDVALQLVHNDRSAAHPSIFRTYCRLRDRFYFPKMLSEVRRYVGSCRECQRRKGVGRRAPLASMPEVTQPFDRVSADLIDMLGSASGHRYVLVIIDRFTRYLQLVPLHSKNAETVADAFVKEYVTLFGPPKALLTDNGAEFINALFRDVCRILQVKTMYATAYHPQANGMVERSNRVIKDSLATLVDQHPNDWNDLLPYVRLALNTALHRSINQKPLYLLTGRDCYFPGNLTNYEDADEDAARTLRERLNDARETAVQVARDSRERQARDHDRRVRRHAGFDVDDLVLVREVRLRTRGPNAALRPRWNGPVRVLKIIGPVNYVVQNPYTLRGEMICHANRLRPYRPRADLEFPEPPQEEMEEDADDPGQANDEVEENVDDPGQVHNEMEDDAHDPAQVDGEGSGEDE